jgi:hypothetical protein
MKKLLIPLALAGIFVPSSTEAAYPYNIVGSGDSIAKGVFEAIVGDKFLNYEPCRAPYDPGCPGTAKNVFGSSPSPSAANLSTIDMLEGIILQSALGSQTFVIVIDGGSGNVYGDYTTLAEYQEFVQEVVDLTTGRCLIFVYPGFDEEVSLSASNVMYSRTIAASNIFAQYTHRCIYKINWWNAVHTHSQSDPITYTNSDGLHPSPAGVAWLAAQINGIV